MTRRHLLTASFALALAVPVGVIAAAANPGHYWLTLLLVAAVMALALGVLGWHLFAEGGPWGPASSAGPPSAHRSGRSLAARQQQVEAAADRASAEALRDTKIIVAAVLIVVAFTGWVWDTSWVLVGVLVVAFGTQAVRQLMAARG